ncbi:MAG: carbon storage regulator [Alphaproteobacteria bacterium]|nr:carbon storage regulator [Alphaproteobacteria bacterium]
MLYLTRKIGESVIVNDEIEVTVVEVRGRAVKLGFVFPPTATVLRRELHERILAERAGALGSLPAEETVPLTTVHEPQKD